MTPGRARRGSRGERRGARGQGRVAGGERRAVRGDDGAGSVLVVGLAAVVLLLGGTLAVAVRAHTARSVAQAVADLAALAAAQTLVLPPGLDGGV
ncbi:MAG: hypothetical protein H5T83_13450, partial [Actinotalea sp.]|nr:hypothetical protein [Actinotalea sp.]